MRQLWNRAVPLLALLLGLALCGSPAHATLISYEESVIKVLPEAPPSVDVDALQSGPRAPGPYNDKFWVFYFEEQSNVLLDFDVPVNITEPGHYARPNDLAGFRRNRDLPYPVLEAGTRVDSHFLHFDPALDPLMPGYIEFDEDIVGVIFFDPRREIFPLSDELFGAPGTIYPRKRKRHLEMSTRDMVWLTSDRRKLIFNMAVGGHGLDQIRILTAPSTPVPEPDALALFGAGALVTGAAVRRRRR